MCWDSQRDDNDFPDASLKIRDLSRPEAMPSGKSLSSGADPISLYIKRPQVTLLTWALGGMGMMQGAHLRLMTNTNAESAQVVESRARPMKSMRASGC
jgi:hypothetical protein